MTTHVTYKPHYCDRKYGEFVADKIYNVRMFGIPRSLPVLSTIVVGRLNSFLLPEDTKFLCNGAFELYPVYYGRPKAKSVTMMKELTFWRFGSLPEYKRKYLKKMFSSNVGMITDTETMKSIILRHMPNLPVEVVNPFCAQPFFENRPSLDEKKLIFIGSFESPNKGYNELIDALQLLRKQDLEWGLYMVGKRGTDFVKNAPENVHITNFVPSLNPFLSKCSIYVHPAHFEPFGVTALEAMSAGVIPVVTAQTGVSEVLSRNGLKSLIASSSEPGVLAEKISEVYNYSMARKRKISQLCKKIVRKSFLEKASVRDYKKAFDKLVG